MTRFYPNMHKTHLKVGILTLIIFIALITGYLWLSGRMNLKSQQSIQVRFPDVMGLEIGDKIMYRGMEVGRVKSLEITGNEVLVTGSISRETRIPSGSQFFVSDSSLMGGKALNISPGDSPQMLDLSKVQNGEAPAGIMTIMTKASRAADELMLLVADVRKENGLLTRSERLMDDAGKAVRSVDGIAGGLRDELTRTINRVDELTSGLNSVVKSNSANIETVISEAPRALAGVEQTLDSLQTLSAKLHNTVDTLNSGKGSAGKMLTDDELYTRLMTSVNNLDLLIRDVREHPRKYIKFSLF